MKILIVDDNPDDRKVLRYIIEAHKHEVIEAGNGQEGLIIATKERPELIISDALMPVIDGFQFLRHIKQERLLSSVPFIFYSATYRGHNDIQLALSLGAAGYIIKPKDPSELWQEVEEILCEAQDSGAIQPELIEENSEYLRRYSEVVATKLEEKVKELEIEVDERRRAEESLRERDAFIRKILESVEESFIVLDRNYRIVSANRAFCRLVGLDEQDVRGKFCHDLSHHVDRPCYEQGEECPVRKTFDTGRSQNAVHTHIDTKGSRRIVEVRTYPIIDALGRVSSTIETINDITEKRRLEEQLRHVQKMEAIGTLAGGVAHDFNNILTAIIGFSSIIKMKLPQNDPLVSSVDQILASADRAANLTRGLLAFSRKQVMKPNPVEINRVVTNVEKLLRRLIGEDIELKTEFSAGDTIVMADTGQIEQVLMNLATNARDAMPEGGTLTITTRTSELTKDYIDTHGHGTPGWYAIISVSDTGCGMDAETLEKIFEPFYTTKELGKGTGLGLSIVYGIISQHNGFIYVSSEPGQGTTFDIFLPVLKEMAVEFEESPQSELQRGSETILVADDDKSLRMLLRELLGDLGYSVIEASDGAEAVSRFIENKDRIDLLLMDVIMPQKGGREAYDEIKVIDPEVKVLFMSGYMDDVIKRKKIEESSLRLLQKPIKPKDLLAEIRAVLDKRQ